MMMPALRFFGVSWAGMDPPSRQLVWDALTRMRESTMIIGTESIEECAALSSRMCVLVEGRMEAIGSVPSLVQRYVSHVARARYLT
jgi:ABC-type multidrug transport system ATPase subunit